jgi:hypothetical protein
MSIAFAVFPVFLFWVYPSWLVTLDAALIAGAIAQVRTCLESGLQLDLALLHVGGNDVVADTPLQQLADDCCSRDWTPSPSPRAALAPKKRL